jgi:hypothetical protein
MADEIRATPRSPLFGLFSDIVNVPLDYMSDPRRTQQMQGLASFIRGTQIPSTLQNLSYDPSGRGLFTGAGGLGGTTRLRPEAIEAALTLAPGVGPAARFAGRGAMAAGRAGEQFAERGVPQIMERGGLPAQLAMGMSNRTISPLDVYHGTPHKFPPTERNPLGEFDASKIGTGEGAQVYGHGLYVAENPTVAQEYQKQLGTQMQYKGQQFYDPIVGRKTGTTGNTDLDDYLLSYLGDTGVIRKELLTAAKEMRDSKNPQARKEYQALMAELRKVRPDVTAANTGSLYKVDLPDEQIGKMLDFDAPLGEQSDYVKNIIKEYELDYVPPSATGGRLIEEMNRAFGPATASMHLRNAGIPGIKYLDQNSRKPGTASMTQAQLDTRIDILKKDIASGLGNQERMKQILSSMEAERALHTNLTRNFVVFPGEEKSMTIFERNGQVASPMYTDPFANTIRDTTR